MFLHFTLARDSGITYAYLNRYICTHVYGWTFVDCIYTVSKTERAVASRCTDHVFR